MKKWLKRSLAVAMMATMMASSLVGCTGKTTSSGDTTEGKTDGGTTTPKVHTLKLLGQEGGNQFIKFEDREQYPVWQELQKLLDAANLKLEYELVPREQYKAGIQSTWG